MATLTDQEKLAQFDSLQQANDTLTAVNASLQQANDTLETDNISLQQENATLTADNEKNRKELETARQVVSDLKKKLTDKDAGTVQLPTVKVGQDTYELTSDFSFGGQEITIELLKQDPGLVQTIIGRGIANLRKLPAKKA